MSEVAKLPSPSERLQREAEKAHKAMRDARGDQLRAEIALLDRPSEKRKRVFDLATLEYHRKRRAWIVAEDKLRDAAA